MTLFRGFRRTDARIGKESSKIDDIWFSRRLEYSRGTNETTVITVGSVMIVFTSRERAGAIIRPPGGVSVQPRGSHDTNKN